jgi:hypothetical protein
MADHLHMLIANPPKYAVSHEYICNQKRIHSGPQTRYLTFSLAEPVEQLVELVLAC